MITHEKHVTAKVSRDKNMLIILSNSFNLKYKYCTSLNVYKNVTKETSH